MFMCYLKGKKQKTVLTGKYREIDMEKI